MKKIFLNNNDVEERIEIRGTEDVVMFGCGGGKAKIEIVLNKEGSCANLYGIFVGKNMDDFEIKTISNHIAPNTNSRVHIKGVLMDKSKLNYEGMIRISKKSQLSDAYLQNDNLMIGDGAIVNSSPQLEIEADDVKASHGVTISNIDEVQEFYLKSRGLTNEIAEDLLIKGFINDILIHAGLDFESAEVLKLSQYAK